MGPRVPLLICVLVVIVRIWFGTVMVLVISVLLEFNEFIVLRFLATVGAT
jgi:hypothetical protein